MLAHCGLKEENEWGEVPGKSEKMRPDPEFNTTIPCLMLHHQKLTNDWGLHRLTGLVCVLVNKRALTLNNIPKIKKPNKAVKPDSSSSLKV